MCEFMKIEPYKFPQCEYTKSVCTLCVLGNRKTYNEAIKKEKENEN